MPLVSDVAEFLKDFAPLQIAESWDNVGLILGDVQTDVSCLMTCLTITPDVVQEALARHVNLIVTHHPLLFKPIQRIVSTDTQGRMLLDLMSSKVAVFSPHTAFDNSARGINQHLAETLRLTGIAPLRVRCETQDPLSAPEKPAVGEPGGGRFGQLSEPIKLMEFIEQIKQSLRIGVVQCIGDPQRQIHRAGIACGAAAEFIPDAIRNQCDVLITGEARFHDCLRARDSGLAMVLAGHFSTERTGIEVLARILGLQFPTIEVFASACEQDPIQFV